MLKGEQHTAILEALTEELRLQFPGAFTEDDDYHLVIPSGATPQTAYVKVDASCLAEAALRAATASPESFGVSQDELIPMHAEATATEAQHAGQWVLVPREPTEAMIGSVHWVRVRGEHTTEHVMAQAYRAMIAAAPPPPAAPPSPAPPSSEREGFRAGDRS